MAKRNRRMTGQSKTSSDAVPSKGNATAIQAGIEELAFKKLSEKQSVTIASLVADLSAQLGYKSDRIISRLMQLQAEGKIKVLDRDTNQSLANYALSTNSFWFWASLVATVLSLLSIYITSGVALYLRYLFGGMLILFLPGYSLVEFLFARRQEMEDAVSRVALSIGLSIAVVPLVALILNYTPFGIRLVPIAITLGAFTAVFLFLGLAKKHKYYKMLNEM